MSERGVEGHARTGKNLRSHQWGNLVTHAGEHDTNTNRSKGQGLPSIFQTEQAEHGSEESHRAQETTEIR